MRPRLKTSVKWTGFPKEFNEQIIKIFRENFATQLGSSQLIIEGRIYSKEILLRVGILEKGRLSQSNFEVSMDYSNEKQDAQERIHNCVDAAASMMMDYFEQDGEVEFPRIWQPFPFQKETVYLQYSTENTTLEAQADALLGLSKDGLVREEGTEIDNEEIPTAPDDSTDTSEEDEDDDGQPRMFRRRH